MKEIAPGILLTRNPGNGFDVMKLFFWADPEKRDPAWIKGVSSGMPDWAVQKEYYINFDSIGGKPVYPEWSEEPGGNVIRPFAIPEHWHRYRTIDPGFRNPFCCLWFAVSPRGWNDPAITGRPGPFLDSDTHEPLASVIVTREHYIAEKRTQWHKRRIHQLTGGQRILFTVIDPEARKDRGLSVTVRGVDYARPTYQQELHQRPFPISTVPWSPMKSEYAAIEKVARLIVTRQFKVFATCLNTIREHRLWRWKERENTADHSLLETPVDKDNHACDCVKMFVTSPWRPTQEAGTIREVGIGEFADARHRRMWARVHEDMRASADLEQMLADDEEESTLLEEEGWPSGTYSAEGL